MSRLRRAILGSLFVGAALAAGCGGGGGAGAPIVPGRAMSGATSVQVKIVVPQKTDASGRRVPKFVSASTKSAVVFIFVAPSTSPSPSSIPPSLTVGNNYTNITPSSAGCTTTSGATSCTLSVPTSITAAGTYIVGVFTYDAVQTTTCVPGTPTTAPCAGNLLSGSFTETTITPGSSNSVNVTLGGIPAFIQPFELLSGLIGNYQSSNQRQLTVFGPGPAQAQFQLKDADGNVIIGSGAPVLAMTSTNPAVLTALVSVTPGPTGLYTMTLQAQTTMVAGQPVVTPTTVPLTLTEVVPGLVPVNAGNVITITVAHSVVYVARPGTILGTTSIDEFLDGNSSPAVTDYANAGDTQLGLAIDPQENLWIADLNNNDIVVFPLLPPGAIPSEAWTFCGIGTPSCTGAGHSLSTTFQDPQYLAFDGTGNLYVSAYNGSVYQLQQYTAPVPGQTPNPAGAMGFAWSGTAAFYFCHSTLDNMGNVYVGYSSPALVELMPGVPSATTVASGANVNGIGWTPDGALWYLNEPISGTDTATKLNGGTFATVATIAGITNSGNQGLAVDSLGNVYVATGGGTGIPEWTAASNWTATNTVGDSQNATFVAVYPDGLFGANNQIGVAKGHESPFPIPTPSEL